MLSKIQKIKNSTVLKSLLINVIIFLILFLFFEPTAKSDDYDMTNLLYGGFDGEYSPFILYIHVFIGYVLKGLLMLFPNISWYYILGFVGMVLSFSAITYVLKKKGVWDKYKLFVLIFLFLSGYEFYIRITFSKISGLMSASGLLLLLYLIEEDRKIEARYFAGCFLVLTGVLVRAGILKMLLFISFSVFLIFCIQNRKKLEKLKRGVCRFAILSIALYAASLGLGKVNRFIFERDAEWAEYHTYNSTRSQLVDYSWPDYYKYQEEYEKLSISENDYKMWKEYGNIADPYVLTEEVMREIRKIDVEEQDRTILEIFLDANKNLLSYLNGNIEFHIFILCTALLCVVKGREGLQKSGIVFLFCILSYYYLFYRGRLQHHIDVLIFITGAIFLLYYCAEGRNVAVRKEPKWALPAFLLLLNVIFTFYNGMTSSSYYGRQWGEIRSQREQYQENYNRMLRLSKDKEHLYIMGAYETNISYPCFNVFQTIEKEFYSNIYRLNQYTMIGPRKMLRKYGIENESPLSQIVNSDKIRYCISEERLFELDIVEEYIREHYDSNAQSSLVRKTEGMYIYRFVSY